MKLHTEMKLAFSVVCLTVSAQAEFKMDRAAMFVASVDATVSHGRSRAKESLRSLST